MDLLILADAADAMETVSEVGSPEDVYEIVAADSMDFKSWTELISEIEKTYPDNVKAISSAYESFLSWFPLCHGYWKKYADHMARLCTVEKAVQVYEEAVQSATYSVGLWVDYCSFSMLAFADPSDVRRIFERGLSYVGKDFLCHKLWDLYIRFELSQQEWSFLAHILIRALKFPTKSLHKYYDNFKEFADFVEEDMSCAKSGNLEPHDCNIEVPIFDDEIYHTIRKLQESSSVELRSQALHKFVAIGEQFYHKSCQLHEEIDYFENYMESDLFSVKPLDDEELQNWHNYLDFIEKQEDFDWAVKLYERCLIPCANYPEFWMRYVEFMESKGGREIANFALERATQVFLKNVSEVHIFNARFREKIGDIEGARAAFHLCDTESDSSFIEMAIKAANMETRLGNVDAALEIYEKALKVAIEKEKMHIIPILYIHFFRLKFMITGSPDAAIDLLISGIQQVPHSRLLLEELINFAMIHEGSRHLDVLDSIVATAITCKSDGSQGLSSRDREDLSHLYLKFVDYCGTTHEITKAWARHIKHFPRLLRCTSSHKCLSNDLVETRDRMPHIVAKQPSQAHVKHTARNPANEKHNLLTSKSQAIELHKATANQYVEKDDNNSVKSKRMKRKSSSVPQNERHESQKSERIRTEPEEEEEHGHEVEASQKPVSLESLSLCTQEEEPNDLTHKSSTALEDTVNPSTANQNSTTDSPKRPDVTDEHGSETDPPQSPYQNVETCKTNHMLTAFEHASPEPTAHLVTIAQLPNKDHPTVLNAPQNAQLTAQYPVQSSEQSGLIQNPQAYNQMMQYQYQQQHQNQQQWLQMQQSYIQQQQQQQQQQQYAPQTQQYQLYQQQEQYQQYWLQMYQQQQQQQMQEYMKMQQYQQIQQQQQQQQQQHQQLPQELHQNHQRQITALANQIWKASQQVQGTIPPNKVLPYAQPNLASVVTQSMAAPTPTNIMSPSNRQQSSDSKYLRSPSFDR